MASDGVKRPVNPYHPGHSDKLSSGDIIIFILIICLQPLSVLRKNTEKLVFCSIAFIQLNASFYLFFFFSTMLQSNNMIASALDISPHR